MSKPIPSAGAIVVMGVCGCGKSTVGHRIAAALDGPFLEGDAFHPPANVEKMSRGMPLEDADRWPWLDELGAALGALSDSNAGRNLNLVVLVVGFVRLWLGGFFF